MKRTLLALLLLCTTLVLAGCGSTGGARAGSGGGPSERFAGHWTMGSAFSVFTTLDGRNYNILPEDMPMEAFQYISAQSPITDVNSPTGEMWSVYMEVAGRIIPMRPGGRSEAGQQRLHADQVLRMDRAQPEFLARTRR